MSVFRCGATTDNGRMECQRIVGHRGRHQHVDGPSTTTWGRGDDWHSTYDTDQPWVAYHYGKTHDKWWPAWSSTRILGFCLVECECAVCGKVETIKARLPRFGPVTDRGKHPKRVDFLKRHAHPDRGHPMSWAKPLLNVAAHKGGLNLDLLGMRIEGDVNNGGAS